MTFAIFNMDFHLQLADFWCIVEAIYLFPFRFCVSLKDVSCVHSKLHISCLHCHQCICILIFKDSLYVEICHDLLLAQPWGLSVSIDKLTLLFSHPKFLLFQFFAKWYLLYHCQCVVYKLIVIWMQDVLFWCLIDFLG